MQRHDPFLGALAMAHADQDSGGTSLLTDFDGVDNQPSNQTQDHRVHKHLERDEHASRLRLPVMSPKPTVVKTVVEKDIASIIVRSSRRP